MRCAIPQKVEDSPPFPQKNMGGLGSEERGKERKKEKIPTHSDSKFRQWTVSTTPVDHLDDEQMMNDSENGRIVGNGMKLLWSHPSSLHFPSPMAALPSPLVGHLMCSTLFHFGSFDRKH